jgi:hypothetical protein
MTLSAAKGCTTVAGRCKIASRDGSAMRRARGREKRWESAAGGGVDGRRAEVEEEEVEEEGKEKKMRVGGN